ncbi:cytochrome c and c1 heme-lyase [Rickenella mellea]|uniref:Holocytochrome c-type synthase n=1 Tax=Rickenella mellea TaxID=50990 RepID=A0A4Y7Q9S5_9AGAM|nr:cytochrome c and c1 heme-lyase [Rickenella mellea]
MGQTASSAQPAQPTSVATNERPAQCPVKHDRPAECPVKHETETLNPLNNIPTLSQHPSPEQPAILPTQRTTSSIPRPDAETPVWEYPSPQQFYNALVRKGWETPVEHVETMVDIHNFLNEQAWGEVLKWERRRDQSAKVELARFRGRPGDLSPKARFMLFAGWLLPSRFNTEPPFDRHDWIVRRRTTGEEVRYVIDYYSAPPEPDGSPVFSLDVRPALDDIGSVKERLKAATEDVWAGLRATENDRDRSQRS